jgi:hypothetical protein
MYGMNDIQVGDRVEIVRSDRMTSGFRQETGEVVEIRELPGLNKFAARAMVVLDGWADAMPFWTDEIRPEYEKRRAACAICDTYIPIGELCKKCAKGNDPFITSKYSEGSRQ